MGSLARGVTVISFRVQHNFASASARRCPSRLVTRRSFSPLAWYNKQLKRSPIITKCITSGVLFGMGDLLAQTVTKEKGGKYDLPRLGRAVTFGAVLLGPLAHLHFNFIEWLIVERLALTGTKMAVSKMFIDQFTYWAAGINTVYLFSLPIMAGESSETAYDNVRNNLWRVLKANWCLWPVAQLINFRLVPVVHQLNFVLVVSLGWATYLSWSTPPATTVKKGDEK